MFRIFIALNGHGISYSYLDSVHAAVIAGLKCTGLSGDQLIGPAGLPWTFAAKGFARPGGRLMLKGLTISTADAVIGNALRGLNPAEVRYKSPNGDQIDLAGARKIAI